ncbi:MAG: phosphate transporter, inner rane subunit PstC [Chloroflexi bacterium]|nr:phosphate transporter, inner rane subunit PstC [Chloroflexota bacterium]
MQNDLSAARTGKQQAHTWITRSFKDNLARRTFFLVSLVPVLLFLAIVGALLVKSWPILKAQPIWTLLSGSVWQPLKGAFGFYPFIAGTFWVTLVSMVLAVPPCILTAIYLAEYAHSRTRSTAKPILDLLAAIPSVVYGVWGILAIVPVVRYVGPYFDKVLGFLPVFKDTNPTGFSILAGGVVLAVMVAPFIIAVTLEVLLTVPNGIREASLAVGATKWQTIIHGVLPHTLPGIIAGVVLGMSRSLGETMAVLMVVGNVAKVPGSIFDPAYPLPALIANNYGEMMSIPLYDSALLTAALILLVIVLFFNILSTLFLRRITRTASAGG